MPSVVAHPAPPPRDCLVLFASVFKTHPQLGDLLAGDKPQHALSLETLAAVRESPFSNYRNLSLSPDADFAETELAHLLEQLPGVWLDRLLVVDATPSCLLPPLALSHLTELSRRRLDSLAFVLGSGGWHPSRPQSLGLNVAVSKTALRPWCGGVIGEICLEQWTDAEARVVREAVEAHDRSGAPVVFRCTRAFDVSLLAQALQQHNMLLDKVLVAGLFSDPGVAIGVVTRVPGIKVIADVCGDAECTDLRQTEPHAGDEYVGGVQVDCRGRGWARKGRSRLARRARGQPRVRISTQEVWRYGVCDGTEVCVSLATTGRVGLGPAAHLHAQRAAGAGVLGPAPAPAETDCGDVALRPVRKAAALHL
jgi:hypothetical protein